MPPPTQPLKKRYASNGKKSKVRIIDRSYVIDGVQYDEKVFVPLESKRTRFLRMLNKKERQPSTAIGK